MACLTLLCSALGVQIGYTCPHRLSAEVDAVLLAAKRAHRHWGPRTILPYLARRRPDLALPAPSTAGELFQREGFSHARTRRRRYRHPGALPLQAEAPHAGWTADVTGQFRPGEGLYGYPLTGADAHRRLLCSGSARLSTTPVEARPIFARRFQDYGLPDAMRPDHGPPCATPACCGLRQLAVGWSTLGLRQQRLAPRRPEPNVAHERLHRTRTAAATRPPAHHQAAPHARFDRCCREYNEERPHEALHYSAPASRSRPSPRALPAELPAPTYPGHDVGRRFSHAGTFRFQTRPLFMSDTLLQEDSALEETAHGIWSISFSDVLLARLDARDFTRYV